MANYNLSLPAETIDSLLLWLDDKQDVIIKQTDLLSGTGQSTTATMTQKAITDALGTKADASSVYTKTQTDTLLGGKADKSTTYTKTETDTLLNGKVDKEAGKGLSTNDYTDADKTKLGALPTAAELDSELAVLAGEAGLAEAVIDTDNAGTEQEFTFRKSGGDGGAYYRKVLGKSVVVNQIITPNPVINTVFSGNETVVANGDGTFTINGTAGASDYFIVRCGKLGIKAYCSTGVDDNTITIGDGYSQAANNIVIANTQTDACYVALVYGTTYNNVKIRLQYCDLTLAGLADEISTPADFEALYHNPLPYNPGTLISNDAEAVETTGVNQWDEENRSGYYGTDWNFTADNTAISSKNLIPIIGGATYYFQTSAPGGNNPVLRLLFFDSNKERLEVVAGTGVCSAFAAPANAAFMHFSIIRYNSATYNNDICINLSNPAINGQYFPYWKRTLHLGITTKKDSNGNIPFPSGLQGVGTRQDWGDKKGGEKVLGVVDLGDLDYVFADLDGHPCFVAYCNTFPDGFPTYGGPISSALYVLDDSISADKTIADARGASTPAEYRWFIRNDAYNDATLFKTAMAGVKIVYWLATPVPFTWAEPLNLGVKVDENGTERAVAPEGATAPSAPFVADTTYTMSVARMVEILKNL